MTKSYQTINDNSSNFMKWRFLMSPKNVGQNVPQTAFKILHDGTLLSLDYNAVFSGRRVIVFSLPGAFTPTCSSQHLPDYEKLYPTFKSNGIDEIYCISVNDPFVMDSWAKDQKSKNVKLLPDGNGDFTNQMGFLVDKSDLGFGARSWRYAMVVNDGVIEQLFVEPDKPGDPFEVSDAHTVLDYVAPNADKPKNITMFSKPGCSHCQRARDMLDRESLDYEEIKLGEAGLSLTTLAAVTGQPTTPQIYIDGHRLGGADELERYFS